MDRYRGMRRDYDRASAGGRFGDEEGDYSRSPERDHSMNRRRFIGEGRTIDSRRTFEGGDDREYNRDDERQDDDRGYRYSEGRRGWDRFEARDDDFDREGRRFGWRGEDYERDRREFERPTRRYDRAGSYSRDFDEMGAGFSRPGDSGRRDFERFFDLDRDRDARYGGGRDVDYERQFPRERGQRPREFDEDPFSRGRQGGYGGGRLEDETVYRFGGGRDYEHERFDRGFDYRRPSRREYDFERRGRDDYGREQYWSGQGGSEFAAVTGRRYTENWPTPGPFSGRGPRGYQISDDRIRDDVSERLYHHGDIDASDIDVRVENGEVTLDGWIGNRRMKRLAEDIADEVRGVQEVHNHLRVRRSQQSDTGDWASRGAGYDFDMTGAPGSPISARQYGSTGTGAGLNATTNTGSGMDTGTTMRTAPGMHSMSGTGTSGSVTSGMGASGHTGVGSVTSGPGTTLGPATSGATPTGARTGGQQAVNRTQLRRDAEVFDADGDAVGTVKELRGNDFLLDRPMARDLYVPLSAVHSVTSDRVMLSVRDDDFDAQGWETPPIVGQEPGTEVTDRSI